MIVLGLHVSSGMRASQVTWVERAWMRHLCRRGMSRDRIAHAFGRSPWAVWMHCRGIARPVRGRLRTDEDRRALSADARAERRAAGRCINGPLDGFVSRRGTVHGPVVRGGKCQRCLDANSESVARGRPRHVSIREVLDAHAHLDLANPDHRELLAAAIRHRPHATRSTS